ncbi:hypothetical protein V1477_002457 [Vespula maculifrons]|uniref:Uncharacterized protein n=1 Tax=Vespula maculifrons TaxID=7453 RepID=A0ABD2CWK4_VESMC
MDRKRRRLRWSRELNEEAEGGTAARSGGCHETLEDDADRPTGPQPLPLLLPRIWRDNERASSTQTEGKSCNSFNDFPFVVVPRKNNKTSTLMSKRLYAYTGHNANSS